MAALGFSSSGQRLLVLRIQLLDSVPPPHSGSQSSVTRVTRDPTPSLASEDTRHTNGVYTYMKAKTDIQMLILKTKTIMLT